MSVVSDASSIVTSVTAMGVAWMTWRTRRAVVAVHDEVKTQNGLTIAALADRAEGRRIDAEIPTRDRTPSEQKYVDTMNKPHRLGPLDPPTP